MTNTNTNANTNTNTNADDSLPQFAKMIDRVGGDHKNYQYEGVRWCRQNEQDGRGGGLVADEMGLGKTLTMIGLLIENFKRRTLIVVPVALIDQWRDQIHRFTGHSPVVFHGKGRKVDPCRTPLRTRGAHHLRNDGLQQQTPPDHPPP